MLRTENDLVIVGGESKQVQILNSDLKVLKVLQLTSDIKAIFQIGNTLYFGEDGYPYHIKLYDSETFKKKG